MREFLGQRKYNDESLFTLKNYSLMLINNLQEMDNCELTSETS